MPFLPADTCPVELLADGNVRALAPVVWTGTGGDTVTVPAGYVSDLGTVPRVVRAILPHDGPAARAFLVHDVLVSAIRAGERAPFGFDAVDTDNVLRVILAELGVGPVRWIYWEGVRCGALGSAERRAGFGRTLPAFLALALPALIVCLPAAAGAVVSRLLLAVFALLAWPWERLARRRRTEASYRVLTSMAPCPLDGDPCAALCEERPDCARDETPGGPR